MQRYVICIDNEGYPLDLTVHKVYQVISDPAGEEVHMIRIVDDSGEDYLHDADRFLPSSSREMACGPYLNGNPLGAA
jgi:hypothetical protein